MITREAEKELRSLARQFKAVAINGPRQSGKTTIARHVFSDRPYVSLENNQNRQFALRDPQGFLDAYADGAILDEVQRTPELFSYLQQILDEQASPGRFILTGSNNFLLQENISQSLAGRIAYLVLLPFSSREIKNYGDYEANSLLFRGFYPPVYDQPVDPHKWIENYIDTYVERDVRQIRNITNLHLFERFLRLCAGRSGQLLNRNNLAIETGVDNKTISSWISILESSYIVHLQQPHFKNFNKRLVKTPKLYFYDVGLACSLLGITEPSQLHTHPLAGSLFENMVVSEILKHKYHFGKSFNLYFWRDNTGHEIDLLLESGSSLHAIEIKSGKTITPEYFKNLHFWHKLTGFTESTIIYQGDQLQSYSNGLRVIPWKEINQLLDTL